MLFQVKAFQMYVGLTKATDVLETQMGEQDCLTQEQIFFFYQKQPAHYTFSTYYLITF